MDKNVLVSISEGLLETRRQAVLHLSLPGTVASLETIWNRKPVMIGAFLIEAFPENLELRDYASRPAAKKRPPPWHFGMTPRFRKAMSEIDGNAQARIVEALKDISENPATVSGDKIKPLTGALQGCWSYRIGDDKLVYFPNQSSGDITLLDFVLRASLKESDHLHLGGQINRAVGNGVPGEEHNDRTMNVLLLEDRSDFREVLHEHLTSLCCEVTSVASGVEGVREIMKRAFDLIICDMMMPQMGGEMFHLAVTRVRPAAAKRFIFFTGHQSNPEINAFFQRVNATVLFKPFKLMDLDAAIKSVFWKLA